MGTHFRQRVMERKTGASSVWPYVQQVSGDPGNVSSAPGIVSVFEVQLEEFDVEN